MSGSRWTWGARHKPGTAQLVLSPRARRVKSRHVLGRVGGAVLIAIVGLGAQLPADAATTIPTLAAGAFFACAASESGEVTCWGANNDGQLGNGTTNAPSAPVHVRGLGSGVSVVAAGAAHACAVTATDGVKCWGANTQGQLGNGTNLSSALPVDVTGLTSGVSTIAAGAEHTCAVKYGGEVLCWGRNNSGQLGNGSFNNSSATPVSVVGLTANMIAAGSDHTCALPATGGGVQCWGSNGYQQLGVDGVATPRSGVPVYVSGFGAGTSAAMVGAGERHTCAMSGSGVMSCWGYNGTGQLGRGTYSFAELPGFVTGLGTPVQEIGVGAFHSCAYVDSVGVKCWGYNAQGQLGDGTLANSSTPVNVPGLNIDVLLGLGYSHSCVQVRTPSNSTHCWGSNGDGELGLGTVSASRVPADVQGFGNDVAAVSAGSGFSCFLDVAGKVRCMGGSDRGQLGDGLNTSSASPVAVTGLSSGVLALASGYEHSCAVTGTGSIKCWGYGGSLALGNGSYSNALAPVDVGGLPEAATSVATGQSHTCAVTTESAAKCWGKNTAGQLGDGSTDDRPFPTQVSGLVAASGVTAISGGDFHTCAVVAGSAQCWGDNSNGQLGDGTMDSRTVPAVVDSLTTGVTAIASRGFHSCAIVSGMAQCWGSNAFGQLGNGSTAGSSVPVPVAGLGNNVTGIAAGPSHTCAIADGAPWCWGDNSRGQLGDGTITSSPIPVRAIGLPQIFSIVAGYLHTCAAANGSGALRCWGDDAYGQIGTPPSGFWGAGAQQAVNSIVFWHKLSGTDAGALTAWKYHNGAPSGFSSVWSELGVSPAEWTAVAACNISGYGSGDLVWFRPSDGLSYIWVMNGGLKIRNTASPGGVDASWQFQACSDFDGDGIADMLWRNSITGELRIWYLRANGERDRWQTMQVDSVVAADPLNYTFLGLADVDGNGFKDIILTNHGQLTRFQLTKPTGSPVTPYQVLYDAKGWSLAKTGDFDGDGRDDELFRYAPTGVSAFDYVTGFAPDGQILTTTQFMPLAQPLAEWTIAAVGNYGNSAMSALLWYAPAGGPSSGQVVRWKMKGRTTLPVVDAVLGIGSGWKLVQ